MPWRLIALVVGGAAIAAVALILWRVGDSSEPTQDVAVRSDLFETLEGRPLKEPIVRPGRCPDPERGAVGLPVEMQIEGALAEGPVHPVSRGIPRFFDFFPPNDAREWRSNQVLWLSEPGHDGPAVVRGRQIHGTARVGFGDGATPRSTLRLPAGPWDEDEGEIRWADRVVHLPDGWRAKVVPIRVRSKRSPDCYFFQLDGEGFSETVLFGVLIQP